MDEEAEILRELVLLRSTAEDDVGPIIQYVSSRLEACGMDLRAYCASGRPAIVAQRGKGGVLLSGHLDTVPHGTGWKREDGEVVAGKLYGRGACDMKGGCTAMLIAAGELAAGDVPFSLCFTTDEETGMSGAAAAAKDAAVRRAPAVLVTEPTAFDIVVREKGLLQFLLRTSGTSAHASMPNLGENAIAKMVGMLCRLEDMQKVPRNPLTRLTMSVDTINGGTQVNVIPSECAAEIDVRYPASTNAESVLDHVRERLGRTGYELEIIHQLDPVDTDPISLPVRILKRAVGGDARISGVPYATEMVMFKGDGKATLTCGPGDPRICHANDEHVAISQVKRAVKVYTRFCAGMADALRS